jgi:hypothetical protein
VFENRALIKIFGPQERELTGNLHKLHNKELITVTVFLSECLSENKTGGARGTYGEGRNTLRFLVGKPERKDP